jgi:hypothetical protein
MKHWFATKRFKGKPLKRWRIMDGGTVIAELRAPNMDFRLINGKLIYGQFEAQNAALLAAAPLMYEALLKVRTCHSIPDAVMELVKTALFAADSDIAAQHAEKE